MREMDENMDYSQDQGIDLPADQRTGLLRGSRIEGVICYACNRNRSYQFIGKAVTKSCWPEAIRYFAVVRPDSQGAEAGPQPGRSRGKTEEETGEETGNKAGKEAGKEAGKKGRITVLPFALKDIGSWMPSGTGLLSGFKIPF